MVKNKEISERLAARREGKLPKKEDIPPKKEYITQNNKTCSQCGMKNKEDAKFCVGCGKNFEVKSQLDKKEEVKTKTCPSCKSEIPENAKFCVVCGETQPIVSKTNDETEVKTEIVNDIPLKLTLQELVLDKNGLFLNNIVEVDGLNDSIDFESVESVTLNEDQIIEIKTKDGAVQIKGAETEWANRFVSKMNESIKKPDPEMMDKIQKAKELLDIGAIDQEEFENIKMKILKNE